MITLQALCAYIDKFLNTPSFKDYTDNGIQVEGVPEITHFATAVTASTAAIEEAIALGAQALIVHHGIFWQGDSYPVLGSKREKLKLLLTHGLSLLAYHLPLDGHREVGNNWKAATDLGWHDLEPFGEFKGTFIGVKGRFLSMSIDDFQQQLTEYYNHPPHSALGGKKNVQSASLVSGGAYKLLPAAAKEGMDCFITGNFDEPAWHHAFEEQINFFAMGHAATEKIGPLALGMHLERTFKIKHTFIDIHNPF